MVNWAVETSLDVQWAHAIAPGANILLVETPVSETEGVHGLPQMMTAENYVINHGMADVISQSFAATEETFPNTASIRGLRGAYWNAKPRRDRRRRPRATPARPSSSATSPTTTAIA